MTTEAAVYAGGVVLVCCVVWQTQRINSTRLSELQHEINGLRDIVSRLFLSALNEEPDGKIAVSEGSEPAEEDTSLGPLPEIKPDLVQVDALCAKLIALAPPKEALPLISTPGSNESGGERVSDLDRRLQRRERRPSAGRLAPGAKLADRCPRVVPRQRTSRIGKILLNQEGSGIDCTIRNISPAGALLLVVDAHSLPEQFDLRMEDDSQHCVTRWRRFDRIGVKFESISC